MITAPISPAGIVGQVPVGGLETVPLYPRILRDARAQLDLPVVLIQPSVPMWLRQLPPGQ